MSRLQRILSRIFIIFAVFLALEVRAETQFDSGRYFQAGSITFDLRDESPAARTSRRIVLNSVPWIDEFMESDPIMNTSIFDIEHGYVDYFFSVSNDLTNNFTRPGAFDPKYEIPGYTAYSGKFEKSLLVLFISQDDEIGHRVVCESPDESGAFGSCMIRARHERDASVFLDSSILRPIPGLSGRAIPPWSETWPTFGPMVDRMREIADCLDVTSSIQAGIEPKLAPPAYPEKFLDDC